MKVEVFGNPTGKKILLLPGTCSTWQSSFQRVIPYLEKDYKIICVNYTGFDGSNHTFPSVELEMEGVEDAIKEKCGGRVHLVYGSSIGATIIALLIERRRIKIDHAVIGSTNFLKMDKLAGKVYAKHVASLFEGMIKDPEKNKDRIRELQKKKGIDMGEDGEKYLEENRLSIMKVLPESVYNQIYSLVTTPLGSKIGTPGCTIHVMYSKKMGKHYFLEYKRHFSNFVIHEFSMGPEGWLLFGEVMKNEFEKCLGVDMDD